VVHKSLLTSLLPLLMLPPPQVMVMSFKLELSVSITHPQGQLIVLLIVQVLQFSSWMILGTLVYIEVQQSLPALVPTTPLPQ
jgi:hypothetical protein